MLGPLEDHAGCESPGLVGVVLVLELPNPVVKEGFEFLHLGFLEERTLVRAQGSLIYPTLFLLELLCLGQFLAFGFLFGAFVNLPLTGVHGQFFPGWPG